MHSHMKTLFESTKNAFSYNVSLTIFQDISAMEEEKDQLIKRVERLKKRVRQELAL